MLLISANRELQNHSCSSNSSPLQLTDNAIIQMSTSCNQLKIQSKKYLLTNTQYSTYYYKHPKGGMVRKKNKLFKSLKNLFHKLT